jgi:membrane associated rhomboid family serine protease
VFPLKDLNPTSRRAVVTFVVLLLNVGVFLFLQVGRDGTEDVQRLRMPADLAFNLEYAAVPCEIVEGEPLSVDEVVATFNEGDSTACDTSPDDGRELFPDKSVWLAMLTSMFLHGGWLHLGGNMLFLWIFGNNVEDRLGRFGFTLFYLAGGVVATIAHVAVEPASTIPVVGASGAIAAVMGAYLVWFPNAPIRTAVFLLFVFFLTEIRARWLLLGWLVLQFFTSPDAGVAWVAHVGGFAFGVVAGLLLRGRGRSARQEPTFSF